MKQFNIMATLSKELFRSSGSDSCAKAYQIPSIHRASALGGGQFHHAARNFSKPAEAPQQENRTQK